MIDWDYYRSLPMERTRERLAVAEDRLREVRQSLAEATEQRDELLEACEHLLLSADASWEINRGGHDWAEAWEEARAAIAKAKETIRTGPAAELAGSPDPQPPAGGEPPP